MKDEGFNQFVLDQLEGLPGLRSRAMFGGHGLYRGEEFFGIVYRGRLYFRTDDQSRARYEARGMKPFRTEIRRGAKAGAKPQALPRYYEVPLDVIESPRELLAWARAAIG